MGCTNAPLSQASPVNSDSVLHAIGSGVLLHDHAAGDIGDVVEAVLFQDARADVGAEAGLADDGGGSSGIEAGQAIAQFLHGDMDGAGQSHLGELGGGADIDNLETIQFHLR